MVAGASPPNNLFSNGVPSLAASEGWLVSVSLEDWTVFSSKLSSFEGEADCVADSGDTRLSGGLPRVQGDVVKDEGGTGEEGP